MKNLKTKLKSFTLLILLTGVSFYAQSQEADKATAALLSIESKGLINNSESVSYMVRLEMDKANIYSIMDKYDMAEMIKKSEIDVTNCYGKNCIVAAGKSLGVQKMIAGNMERFGEKIIITLKVIDVKTETIEKQNTIEYQNLQLELQRMIAISVQKLVGLTPDQEIVNLLIKYDAPISSPQTQIKLSGPRMGSSMTFGDAGVVLTNPESEGGFNMYPANFQIGWQFEKQYISAGNFQALVEFIPMIGGLESGSFIPSTTFLNGFRMGKVGWELAFGPNLKIVKKADGYWDNRETVGDKKWHLENEWTPAAGDNPNTIENRLDSRGKAKLSTSLFIGMGRTFKSGYLNIPVNIYVLPRKEGTIAGFSFGFNIYKKPKSY